ncbi:MAG: metal transporter [Desulfobacterales bacterium]
MADSIPRFEDSRIPVPEVPVDRMAELIRLASLNWLIAMRFAEGLSSYTSAFASPALIASAIFAGQNRPAAGKVLTGEWLRDQLDLLGINFDLAIRAARSGLEAASAFHSRRWPEEVEAWTRWLLLLESEDSKDLVQLLQHRFEQIDTVVRRYPEAIREIGKDFGFHFDDGDYTLKGETERFYFYQVLPKRPGVSVRKGAKPILVIPPAVLGPNILAFLPRDNRSFVHAFANKGFPTYVRITKPIADHPPVQLMSMEEDVTDTRRFCENLLREHGRPATLCGYCQGGFLAVLAVLSGELDGLVDALMTCVSPMDGTRSKGLTDYLSLLPPRFRELGYALKTLPNGNSVVDGILMSWMYRLKSIEADNPVGTFYRDLEMIGRFPSPRRGISRTAAGVSHWLIYERVDLPEAITRLSHISYTNPVSPDGTLPIRLFGRALNFTRIKEKKIDFLICYAEKDNLVEPPSALAPADFMEVRTAAYPKGHVAIATSCIDPEAGDSSYLCTSPGCIGPVEFQMEMDAKEGKDPS